jgi:3-keto-5-aminohexanoate cleavage enzyme
VAGGAVIIEAAINGVTTKDENPHTPRTPDEIAADALRCLEAGAAIVHNHVDVVGVTGAEAAARYLEGWQPVWRARPDALLYPTFNYGLAGENTAHQRLLAAAGLRIGLVDPGSVNLGRFVYVNSADDIDEQLAVCHECALGPSMAIFEPGFLRVALRLWEAGRLPAGAMLKLYFGGGSGYLGGVFGLPPTPAAFHAYLSMLDGCDLPWSAAVIGGDVVESGIARLTLEAGGHLHTGLEDYRGDRQPTNEDLVAQAVELAGDVGRAVATSREAAALLRLPDRTDG